jgi:hypothetical protein
MPQGSKGDLNGHQYIEVQLGGNYAACQPLIDDLVSDIGVTREDRFPIGIPQFGKYLCDHKITHLI